ncbi:hypothetical protein ACFFX0_18950 [Citricoccus parietis]|uniref:Uncharacterized protein n=1 Tax=Citricoccus parietis TaxID=592307 RepID=A0ABV5G2K2_9MICC
MGRQVMWFLPILHISRLVPDALGTGQLAIQFFGQQGFIDPHRNIRG